MMPMTMKKISQLLPTTLILTGFVVFFGSIARPDVALAQGTSMPALSTQDIQNINNQPIAPSVGGQFTKESRQPSYDYTDGNGTQVREYRDANSPTEVQVKSRFGTYEMAPPATVMPGTPMSSDGDQLSVPSISIPF